jgi:polyphosphate kinase
VETAFPVESKRLRRRILKDGLELYLSDNTDAWELQKDGEYKRRTPTAKQQPFSAQRALLEKIG